jgi:hypothetical protein
MVSPCVHPPSAVTGGNSRVNGTAFRHRNHEDGTSRLDPERQVGVFNPAALAGLPALRAAELDKFRWLAGQWTYQNRVPATSVSPAYTDVGSARLSLNEKNNWICMLMPDGEEFPQITFDPFSRQWIYLLTRGSYGMLRSTAGWQGDSIAFTGLMTMIGINTEWRMTWTRHGDDRFSFMNKERAPDGSLGLHRRMAI